MGSRARYGIRVNGENTLSKTYQIPQRMMQDLHTQMVSNPYQPS